MVECFFFIEHTGFGKMQDLVTIGHIKQGFRNMDDGLRCCKSR